MGCGASRFLSPPPTGIREGGHDDALISAELAAPVHAGEHGGTVVNVIAYKADYVTATEQLKVLDATARDKKCAIPADQ